MAKTKNGREHSEVNEVELQYEHPHSSAVVGTSLSSIGSTPVYQGAAFASIELFNTLNLDGLKKILGGASIFSALGSAVVGTTYSNLIDPLLKKALSRCLSCIDKNNESVLNILKKGGIKTVADLPTDFVIGLVSFSLCLGLQSIIEEGISNELLAILANAGNAGVTTLVLLVGHTIKNGLLSRISRCEELYNQTPFRAIINFEKFTSLAVGFMAIIYSSEITAETANVTGLSEEENSYLLTALTTVLVTAGTKLTSEMAKGLQLLLDKLTYRCTDVKDMTFVDYVYGTVRSKLCLFTKKEETLPIKEYSEARNGTEIDMLDAQRMEGERSKSPFRSLACNVL